MGRSLRAESSHTWAPGLLLESLEGGVAELVLREQPKAAWQGRSYSFVLALRS